MSKRGSEFLKGFGTGYEILKVIINAVLDRGGTDDNLRCIIAEGSTLPHQIAELVLGTGKQEVKEQGTPPPKKFSIWKTINLGVGPRTATEIIKDFNKMSPRMEISGLASALIGNPSEFFVAFKELEVNLVIVTVKELGFEDGVCSYQDICTRGIKMGLTLCPPEVGPQLRRQYFGRGFLWIAMNPITVFGGDSYIFVVGTRGGELDISTSDAISHKKESWGPNCPFVFICLQP